MLLIIMLNIIPEPLREKSRVQDLKQRLDWGEPALTLIDVRSREAFNVSHITGAISVPLNELVAQVMASLEVVRDIYLYGASGEETLQAKTLLKEAGYQCVAELEGGLAAWKAMGYPIEGNEGVIA